MRHLMRIVLGGSLAMILIIGPFGSALAQSEGSYSSNATDRHASASHLDSTGYTADQNRSESLTDYLKSHKLPLVGAQVLKNESGSRAVVLYGYTGSEFGKKDAATKSRKYLKDSSITVDNRIKVRPELLASGRASEPARSAAPAESSSSSSESSAESADNSNYPDANSYASQGSEAQQYAQTQGAGSAMSSATPLLMLGMIALSAVSGGGSFQIGSGGTMGGGMGSPFGGGIGGGSPFGPPQPYNPYPGYPVMPPASSYGSGSSPYGP